MAWSPHSALRRRSRLAWSLLSGMALLTSGCSSGEQSPVSAKNSKFQVAGKDGATDAADPSADSATGANSSESPGVSESSGASESSGEPNPSGPSGLDKPPSRPPIDLRKGRDGAPKTAGNGQVSVPGGDPTAAADSPRNPRKNLRLTPETIPDGTPDELLALLDDLEQQGPKGRTNRELLESLQLWLQNRLAIVDKVLASDANEKQRVRAAASKKDILLQMTQAGFPEIEQKILAFCKELQGDKAAPLVKMGKLTELQLNLAMLMSGATTESEGVQESITAALAIEEDDDEVFQTVVTAAVQLQSAGLTDAALVAYKAIQTRYGESQNERIHSILEQIGDLAKIVEIKFDPLRRAVATDEPDSAAPFLAAIDKLLSEKPGPVILERLSGTAQELEATQHYDIAKQLYERLETAFKDHPNAEVAKVAALKVARGRLRAKLVGESLTLDGKLLNGKELDWKAYEGKVVLVSFWVTSFPPCLEELPNLKRSYDRYHKQGFEIVSVTLDQDPQEIEQFFAVQSLPWPTIPLGKELAEKCGVESILPFTLLIGRDGKVTDIHLRGDILVDRLAAIFEGDQPAAKSKAASAEKPAVQPDAKSDAKPESTPEAKAEAKPEEKPGEKPEAKPEAPSEAKPEPKSEPKPGDGQASTHRVRGTSQAFVGTGLFAPQGTPATRSFFPTPTLTIADEAPVKADPAAAPEKNPYLAKPGLKPAELVDYLLKMDEKPKSIKSRPGFSEAIVDAADRVLAAEATDKFKSIAAQAKIDILHNKASLGDQAADEQLQKFVDSLVEKPLPALAGSVQLLLLERKVIKSSDVPAEKLPELLDEVKKFVTDKSLDGRHLRLASSTVEVINRIESDEAREKQFAEFGKLFSKSSDKELARYGKKLAKAPPGKESDLVGKPLELAGTTASGTPFDWKSYRGKVVIVDFWATWCGPCVKELPNVKATYEKYKEKGFDIVGVSLDQDLGALAEFIEKHQIPWQSLSGDGTQELAQKYGVRGIPTVMLVDQEGNVVAVTHRIDQLVPEIEKLLKK